MAMKSIVIWIALCATLAAAIDQDLNYPPGHSNYQGLNNPNFPTRVESTNIEDISINKNYDHKTHFIHHSEESQEPDSHDKWERKKHHHHDWHIPHFPHHHEYPKKNFAELERRRPLFFPYHPYHPYNPFYPYHPSHNDAEFETIEALKSRNYHGSHNPNFPLNQDDFQETYKKPFHHGFHNPHFPFNFESSEESSEEMPHFEIPSFLIDLYELLHNNHWKPEKPHHEHPLSEEENDKEGSGEEEIIPLFNTADIPLVTDDNDDQGEENDYSEVVPALSFRSILESRKSIPINCDALNTPRYSCYNCYNYLVCKSEGGKIKSCKDPFAPYCNNGICSNTPSPDCSNLLKF